MGDFMELCVLFSKLRGPFTCVCFCIGLTLELNGLKDYCS